MWPSSHCGAILHPHRDEVVTQDGRGIIGCRVGESILATWMSQNLSRGSDTPVKERFKKDPEPVADAPPLQAMRHRMNTREGKALYAKRKSTVETVFGIIKQVLGFRQFLLRGFDSVQSEWALVCIGWNLKRMHALKG